MSKPKHILVIRFSAMGDVAMTIPVLTAFTKYYPKVKITVVTRAFFTPFFRNLENVEVVSADLEGKHKGVLGLYKLFKELNALQIDAVADLHNVLRSKILKYFFLGKTVVQLDKGRSEKKALTTGKIFQQLKTTHQRYVDVFEALGYPIDLRHPNFPSPNQLSKKLDTHILNKVAKTLAIAPFATYQSKMYPIAQMESVVSILSKEYNIILFGGGDKEIDILNQFETKYGNVSSVAGKLTLDEELDLISNTDAMLSMDSGNAHIAAMLGKKVVTIWGATHPFAGFAPFNQPDHYALLADRAKFPLIPTSIYGNAYPKGYEDVAGSISIETIVSKVQELLEH